MDSRPGTYLLILRSDASQTVAIGRLGVLAVRPGVYVYAGSALGPGGVAGRLRHHARLAAAPCWHIDYLRPAARLAEVWYAVGQDRRECAWAGLVAGLPGAEVPLARFGASDCRCPAHLFYFERTPSLAAFRRFARVNVRRVTRDG